MTEITDFGSNPGGLRMLSYVPSAAERGAPLVVALHGCGQTALSYDTGAGWSELAERHGFAVLAPEQQRANNANLCFNWFEPADVAREGGEAESIRQMISRMVADHRLDRSQVFITGLSAGGAMTASMLAAYPEVFAGGAIIAGLPHGAASSVHGAIEAMFQGRAHPADKWGDLVRAASPDRGGWPAVQVWHGTADTTVKPSNAEELVKQWTDVHGLSASPDVTDTVDGAAHEAWFGLDGRVLLESYLVPGMGHGTPIHTHASEPDQAVGHAGPYMLETDIASTWHIAQSWGLLSVAPQESLSAQPAVPLASEAYSTIEMALRAAGLRALAFLGGD